MTGVEENKEGVTRERLFDKSDIQDYSAPATVSNTLDGPRSSVPGVIASMPTQNEGESQREILKEEHKTP